ncbi:MAG TPA: hypothetical protein VFQ20_00295 [Burkholderiaceae bacterium]|nr:hypothetical protein [Burkholderiaceae bacterium]
MAQKTPSYTPSRSGLMDFEPVSIDSARAALDELPPDVVGLINPEYWVKARRAPLATDRALTGRTLAWLGELPPELRPQATIERYARIVNSIADAWPDARERDKVFDHLLNDRRRGRRGFPIDVEREISTLWLYASGLPQ